MSGKHWHPNQPMTVTREAGEQWCREFPRLALWASYRAGAPCPANGGVRVVNRGDGVCYHLRPVGAGWEMVKIQGVK